MFGSLIRKAQVTVDNAIGQLVNRVVIAVPFLVAAGFATAALSIWLTDRYGAQTSNLIMAAGFGVIGLIAALSLRSGAAMDGADEAPVATTANGEAVAATDPDVAAEGQFSEVDRDLILSALTAAVPVALPLVLRNVLRNLPLVLVVVIAGFVVSRITSAAGTEADGVRSDTAAQPAE